MFFYIEMGHSILVSAKEAAALTVHQIFIYQIEGVSFPFSKTML
ncbi:hypothetical protein [Paenibacillus sp. J45TS6]|nr:hypothetical protein [Paenibacillus sp. J45TS6]